MPLFVTSVIAAPPAMPCSASPATVVTLTASIISEGITYPAWCGSQRLTLEAPSMRVTLLLALVPLMFVRNERIGVSVIEFWNEAGVAPGTRLIKL